MTKYRAVALVPIEFEFPAFDAKDAHNIAMSIACQSVTRLSHPGPVINYIEQLKEPHVSQATA